MLSINDYKTVSLWSVHLCIRIRIAYLIFLWSDSRENPWG